MKNILNILFVFLLILGCQKDSSSPTESNTQKLGEAFDLKIGQAVSIKDEQLTIQFVNVPSDSRCPKGAMCIWAGNALVQIKVSNNLDTLNTIANPSEMTSGVYTIRLLDLMPYPSIDTPKDTTSYVAKLLVTKS